MVVQVAARQQMLMHPNRALKLAAASKQIAQRKVQLGGVRVVLNSFNKSVNGLVLLFIEQKIQALEIGFGRLAVFNAQLPEV